MTASTPPELQGYQQYKESGWKVLLLWVVNKGAMAVLLLACFVGAIVFGIMKAFVAVAVCGAGIIALMVLVCYCQGRFGKFGFLCYKCRKPMDVFDIPVPAGHMKPTRFRSVLLTGADGLAYLADGTQAGRGSWSFTISQLRQQWYVCHKCKRCLLGADGIWKPILQTQDDEGFERAKQLLMSDPGAAGKIQEGTF